MYEQYKPLRNYIFYFPVGRSFEELWAFFQYYAYGNPPLPHFGGWAGSDFRRNVHPWELALLAREVAIHAQHTGNRSLHNYEHFRKAINHIRRVDEEISDSYVNADNVLEHMHRIAHQQFPWQARRPPAELLRYLKIFGEARVEAVYQESTGTSMRDLFVFHGIGHHRCFAAATWHQRHSEVYGIRNLGGKLASVLRRSVSR